MQNELIGLNSSVIPWIMRKLGEGFIKSIAISEDQILDCLEEASSHAKYYYEEYDVSLDYLDIWAKNYALALCKKQVGMNGMRYENVRLPGGLMFNSKSYIRLADKEIRELNKNIRREF